MKEKKIDLVYYWNWYWDGMMRLNNKQGLSLYYEKYDYIKEKADKSLFDEIYKKIIKKLNEVKIKYDTKELDLSNKGKIERSIITYWDNSKELDNIETIVHNIIEEYGLERGTLFFTINIIATEDKIILEVIEDRDSDYDKHYEIPIPSPLREDEDIKEEIQQLFKKVIEYINYEKFDFEDDGQNFWVIVKNYLSRKDYDDFINDIKLYINFLKKSLMNIVYMYGWKI